MTWKTLSLLAVLLSVSVSLATAGDFSVGQTEPSLSEAERVGPPVYFLQNLTRYGERTDPERYDPIPRDAVTRESYFQWLEASGHLSYADRPDRVDPYGPRHFMPVLAAYVKTGDRRMGEACIRMLQGFYQWLQDEVARSGRNSSFIDEPGYIGLYKRYLEEGGLLDVERDTWFRDLVLLLNRTMHVWGGPEHFWRGPMHRAQGEIAAKRLALFWFPDIPEAEVWSQYVEDGYNDFWLFRDNPVNDSNYYLHCAMPPLVLSAELTGNTEFFTDARMQRIWERLMYEVSPDGAVVPYGAHGGWNHSAAPRIYMLEAAARHTGDGRYRYAAHKLFNYMRYQQERYWTHHMAAGPASTEKIAVAYLLADDSIAPVQPDAGSQILYHQEMLRVRSKESAGKYFAQFGQAPLDPDPVKHHVDCAMINTPEVKPFKLILRSGWNPGDFFAEIELYPRHDPLNPPGILGMTRWGACLGMPIDAKGSSDENRLMIEDLSGTATLRFNTDPDLNDRFYQEVEIPEFTDLQGATFVTVEVADYQGFPVRYTREFLFIKNRFLVTRDIPLFEEGFLAQVAPVYNTQNAGPQVGTHWANTFFSAPRLYEAELLNPSVDLLVWFAPREDCRLQVVDRTASDVRAIHVPVQLRYAWQGLVEAGQSLLFTQVLYPQKARFSVPRSNMPGAARPQDVAGTAGADGIQALRDDLEATVLRLTLEEGREEWVVSNPGGEELTVGDLTTDARYLYLDTVGGEVKSVSAVGASRVYLRGKEVLRRAERGNTD